MIRDPSDGSVKEITPPANDINEVIAEPHSEEITSGLRAEKPGEFARLEKSRAWLKQYFSVARPA